MNKPMIIPAIDLKNGECVRLTQGKKEESKSYSKNPVEMAQFWQDEGAKRLHIVDLDGAFAAKPKNLRLIEKIRKAIQIPIQVGGGIRSDGAAWDYLNIGINQVIIGTKAIDEPEWFSRLLKTFPNKVILGLDAYGMKIATSGWEETSNSDLFTLAKSFDNQNLFAIVYTDISRDGMLTGINWKKTSELAKQIQTKVIASGGLSDMNDIIQLKTHFQETKGKLMAAIAGKSLYEKTLDFKEAQKLIDQD